MYEASYAIVLRVDQVFAIRNICTAKLVRAESGKLEETSPLDTNILISDIDPNSIGCNSETQVAENRML